jgi:hypothetical protein
MTLTAKRFIKMSLIAAGFQMALLVVMCPLVSRAFEKGRDLPDFLVQYVYSPFVRAVIYVGGYQAERAMIWPPVLGLLLGIAVYSVMFALALGLISGPGDHPTGSQ